MGTVSCQISMSLDGYVAGPEQSLTDPLGRGGLRLHEWLFGLDAWRERHGLAGGERNVDAEVVEEAVRDVGAYVMGRRMFGGGDGPWDLDWRGWWGEDPPWHAPVFVLTHRPRETLVMRGGTEFHFVTDGIEAALRRARAATGTGGVQVTGGADTVRQFLTAGLLDTLQLHLVPIVLGAGERLFEGVDDLPLEQVSVIAGPTVTHVTYRVRRQPTGPGWTAVRRGCRQT
ncbi:dihydrofolate reductase family protein [Micromonospora halophytica]|uniref:RibD C-terminal domain-containing protein n=1 Tax=Micromonospora halophytica TaxID=47864 RepID=A0A1C5IWN9_9ACTN|nr:dihydrofolate reductase family protein [Micromonospora halophytica]SCG62431.1 RibD C-terminal domain-containing protein [Micromonospora halophytica]